MTKPAVVLIGADKGGVGKTTVARTLLDYFAHHQVRARAFDTEMPRGTLKRFHPDVTDVVDINHVPDQMRIFDTVNSTDAAVSLIDVRAGLLSPTLRALRNIGFIEAAKKGHITFVLFHILGPSIASLDEIAETAAYLGDGKYFMVKNFINNTDFFELSGTRRPTRPISSGYLTRSKSRSPSSLKWRPSKLISPPFRLRPSSPTGSRAGTPPLIHSCSGAMSIIGSAPSGPSTTASASPTSWKQRNPPGPWSARRDRHEGCGRDVTARRATGRWVSLAAPLDVARGRSSRDRRGCTPVEQPAGVPM